LVGTRRDGKSYNILDEATQEPAGDPSNNGVRVNVRRAETVHRILGCLLATCYIHCTLHVDGRRSGDDVPPTRSADKYGILGGRPKLLRAWNSRYNTTINVSVF